MQLHNKIAIITGADSGIGQATAEAFAKAGADVLITYHTDADGAAETKRPCRGGQGRRATVVQCDIREVASVQAAFDRTVANFGTPDILIANAGLGMGGMPVAEMDDDNTDGCAAYGPCRAAVLRTRLYQIAQSRRRQGQAGFYRISGRAFADSRERALRNGKGGREFAGSKPFARGCT